MKELVFDALADTTRRRVLEQLARGGPMRAGELSESLQIAPPALSRHLKVLVTAGLIADERVKDDNRMRYFRIEPEALAAAQAYLDQLQMEWRTQLESFKRLAEGKRPQ